MRTSVRILAVMGLIALIGAGIALTREQEGSPVATSPLDVPFIYLDGSPGNLSDFAGTPLVVNFWASWCPACVAEMPDFEQVHDRLGEQVVFLGLNMQEIDRAAAARLVEETGVSYLLGADPDGAVFRRFGGIAMPTTVFVGADGAVVAVHAGALFAADLEERIRTDLLAS